MLVSSRSSLLYNDMLQVIDNKESVSSYVSLLSDGAGVSPLVIFATI